MVFTQNLPYITEDLPGIGGKIKSKPENFVVEEIPSFQPLDRGSHLYINITKKGVTSRDLQEKIANILDKRKHDIGLAGLKDKHALATQTFSVNLGLIKDEEIHEIINSIESKLSITVNWFKRHPKKLRRGHLKGNKFRIFLTDVEVPLEESIKICMLLVNRLKIIGLPNFYGYQRTGRNLENVEKGYKLLIGSNKLENNPWLRRFLISSFQSFLCNEYLISRIKKGVYTKLISGDIVQKHDTGGIFRVKNLEKEQIRFRNKEISFTVPIYGYNIDKASDTSGLLENEILRKYDLDEKLFKENKLKGTRRIGRIFPKISMNIHGEGLKFEFFLPKGSYATILMREFIKD